MKHDANWAKLLKLELDLELDLLLVAKLAKLLLRLLLGRLKKQQRTPRAPKTIVDVLAKDKKKKTLSNVLVILSALALYHLAAFLSDFSPSWGVTWVAVGFAAALTLDGLLMAYRAARGWYGTNAMEAMEIVRFVASRKPDDGGTPPIKKVLRDPQVKQIVEADEEALAPEMKMIGE